jgi:hypothetical protein
LFLEVSNRQSTLLPFSSTAEDRVTCLPPLCYVERKMQEEGLVLSPSKHQEEEEEGKVDIQKDLRRSNP